MCSGSEEGSYLRLIDFVYHPTLGLGVIQKKKIQDKLECYALDNDYAAHDSSLCTAIPGLNPSPQTLRLSKP